MDDDPSCEAAWMHTDGCCSSFSNIGRHVGVAAGRLRTRSMAECALRIHNREPKPPQNSEPKQILNPLCAADIRRRQTSSGRGGGDGNGRITSLAAPNKCSINLAHAHKERDGEYWCQSITFESNLTTHAAARNAAVSLVWKTKVKMAVAIKMQQPDWPPLIYQPWPAWKIVSSVE